MPLSAHDLHDIKQHQMLWSIKVLTDTPYTRMAAERRVDEATTDVDSLLLALAECEGTASVDPAELADDLQQLLLDYDLHVTSSRFEYIGAIVDFVLRNRKAILVALRKD